MSEELNQSSVQVEQVQSAPTSTPSLQELVSDEYRPLVETKGFSQVDDVLKSYSNLEKMVGNSIRLPNPDSSDQFKQEFYSKLSEIEGVVKLPTNDTEKEQFFNKLGRPEESSKYDLGELNNVFEPEISNTFKNLAHKIGLTNDQAKALAEFEASFMPSEEELMQEQQQYTQQAEQELRKVWGQDYDNRVRASLDVLNKYEKTHPDAVAELKQSVGNNPALRVILADLAESFQEKGVAVGSTHVGMSAQGASQRIQELKADKGFMQMYLDSRHPGHADALEKMSELYKIKHS